MKKQLLIFALLASTIAPVWADDAKPVAVVNGREIPAVYGDIARQTLLSQGAPDDANLTTRVREALINQELLSRAAIDKGLDKNPRLAAAIEMQRREELTKAYLEDYVSSHPVSDADINAEYDRIKAAATGQEYKLHHILVKTESEAKSIIAQLKKKPSLFDKLAKEKSLDPGSAKNGGDLDWNVPQAFVKEFADAVTGMKKGETSAVPVQTKYGYHIIHVDDVRPVKVPPLEEVKSQIVRQLQQRKIREAIGELRAKAKIE